jgi:precorrin-2 methylase
MPKNTAAFTPKVPRIMPRHTTELRQQASKASILAYHKNKEYKATSLNPEETVAKILHKSGFQEIGKVNHSFGELRKIDDKSFSRAHMSKN